MITHEVTNVESDRAQLAHMAEETRGTLEATNLYVIADRGYFSSEQILACGGLLFATLIRLITLGLHDLIPSGAQKRVSIFTLSAVVRTDAPIWPEHWTGRLPISILAFGWRQRWRGGRAMG